MWRWIMFGTLVPFHDRMPVLVAVAVADTVGRLGETRVSWSLGGGIVFVVFDSHPRNVWQPGQSLPKQRSNVWVTYLLNVS